MRFLYKGPGQKITCVCELFSKLIELILDSSKLLPVEKIVKSISIFLCIWANQASAINLTAHYQQRTMPMVVRIKIRWHVGR